MTQETARTVAVITNADIRPPRASKDAPGPGARDGRATVLDKPGAHDHGHKSGNEIDPLLQLLRRNYHAREDGPTNTGY